MVNVDTKDLDRPASKEAYIATPYNMKQQSNGNAPVVLFLHPPKCGGTTIHFNVKALQESLGQRPYKRFAIDRTKYDPPNLMVSGWTGSWSTVQSISAKDIKSSMNRNISEPIFFSGHFPCGIHEKISEFFPERPIEYMSVVRDPVAREFSSMRYQASHHDYSYDRYMNLLDKGGILDNPQTRIIAGYDALLQNKCTQETLDQAKSNIKNHFNLFADADNIDDMMSGFLGVYQLPSIAYHHANMTVKKDPPENIDELTTTIYELHSYDVELVNYAKDYWNNWKKDNVASKVELEKGNSILYVPADYNSSRKYSRFSI